MTKSVSFEGKEVALQPGLSWDKVHDALKQISPVCFDIVAMTSSPINLSKQWSFQCLTGCFYYANIQINSLVFQSFSLLKTFQVTRVRVIENYSYNICQPPPRWLALQ